MGGFLAGLLPLLHLERKHPSEVYITVDADGDPKILGAFDKRKKTDKILIGKLSNYFALLSLLFVHSFLGVPMPDSIYMVFVAAIIGIDAGAFATRILKTVKEVKQYEKNQIRSS